MSSKIRITKVKVRGRPYKAKNKSGGLINKFDKPVGLVTIPKSVHGVASSIRVTLMYQETFITTSTGGYLTLRANDLFDPQATAAGLTASGNQQPQFYDAWKLQYNKYLVLGSKISVKLCNNNANAIPTFWAIAPEDQLVTTSNAAQSSVARFAKSAVYPNGPSVPSHSFNLSMTTAKINGIPEVRVLSDDAYYSAVGVTPADPWYWQIRYSSADFTTNSSVWGFVHVTFDCLFSDPLQDDDNDYLVRINQAAITKQEMLDKQAAKKAEFLEAVRSGKSGKDEESSSSSSHFVVEDYNVVPPPTPLKRVVKSFSHK